MKITTSTSRVRTSFDSELELPRLHQWFAENPHPSRLTLQMYVKELNGLASRQSRKLLEVHNLCYWFKNARAAYKRAELRMKRNHNQPQQQNLVSSMPQEQMQTSKTCSELSEGLVQRSQSFRLTPSKSSPSLHGTGKSLPSHKSPPRSSPNLIKKMYYPRANLMMSSSEELSREKAMDGLDLIAFKSKVAIGGSSNDISSPQKCFDQKLMTGFVDSNTSSSENGTDSPSRADSSSPSSTKSLPEGNISSNSHHQATVALNNVDFASAVNCLLNTATVAAAAAAAAASSSLPSVGSMLHSPPSAAVINLAATLLNSNLINVGNQIGDQSAVSMAAALNSRAAAAALVDPPIRQLFTAFNPSNQHVALGRLDNKVLDSNILNSMVFPTSACASNNSSRHAFSHYLHSQQYPFGQHNGGVNFGNQKPQQH